MTPDGPHARGDRRPAGVCRYLAAAGLILTVCAVVATQLLGDLWWPTVILLFGPRWILIAIPALTLPLLIRSPRVGAAAAVLAFGAIVFGVLDMRTGAGPFGPTAEPSLRVVEFNMAGKAAHRAALATELGALKADAAFLVECPADAGRALAAQLAWNVETTGRLCLLSRHPIRDWAARDQMEFWRRSGSGAIARATLERPGGGIRVGLVHLATPRNALETLRDLSELPFRGPVMKANMMLRDDESRAARVWIGGPDEVSIIAGDFNLPVESAIYRRHWGDYTNAFSRSGTGLGHTKLTRWFGVRIDHVLTGTGVSAVRTTLGPSLGSDHRIVVADLVVNRRLNEPPAPGKR